jgi:hypothetical protein
MLSEKITCLKLNFRPRCYQVLFLHSPAEGPFLEAKKRKNTPPYPRGNSKVNRVFQQSTVIK